MSRDILYNIQNNMASFSKGQKLIAKYILENYDKAAFMTASRLGKTGIRSAMKEIGRREGMDCKVYPHKMRKTLGMNLKNRGANIGDIQEIMGHANPTVTSRYYAQSTPETLRDVRRRTA